MSVVEGLRLTRPRDCTDEIYSIMMQCWETLPKDRLDFEDLTAHLHLIQTEWPSTDQTHLQRLADVARHSYMDLVKNGSRVPKRHRKPYDSGSSQLHASNPSTAILSAETTSVGILPRDHTNVSHAIPSVPEDERFGDLPPPVEDDVLVDFQYGIAPSCRVPSPPGLLQKPILVYNYVTDV
jgi:hypothetical protein